jgi:hypothetical protein
MRSLSKAAFKIGAIERSRRYPHSVPSHKVREGVKAVLEEVLEAKMTKDLEAGYRELTQPGAESAPATTPEPF